MEKILVIAAHPDDELLGCGGICINHSDNGDSVRAVIMCEGESMRYGDGSVNQTAYIEKAAKIIGFDKIYHLKMKDQHLDSLSLVDIITPLEKIIMDYQPTIIYCQSGTDINKDHQLLFEAACVALRPVNHFVNKFYTFYTPSSSEWGYNSQFQPNYWFELSQKEMDRKIAAFECYLSENKMYPHPRSSKSLKNMAEFFGNQSDMFYAEVFHLVREVKRK